MFSARPVLLLDASDAGCCWLSGRTDGQGQVEGLAGGAHKVPSAEGDQLVPKHDGLLREQGDGAEGATEVMVVNVRRDAVDLRKGAHVTLSDLSTARN